MVADEVVIEVGEDTKDGLCPTIFTVSYPLNPLITTIVFRPREGQQRKAHSDSEDLQRMARPDASEGHALISIK